MCNVFIFLSPCKGSLAEKKIKKRKTKQDQVHDNKETDEAASTSCIKDKLQKKT
jgi:hypothetical protein